MTLRLIYDRVSQMPLSILDHNGDAVRPTIYGIDAIPAEVPQEACPARVMAPHAPGVDAPAIQGVIVGDQVQTATFRVVEWFLYYPLPAGGGISAWTGALVDALDVYRKAIRNIPQGKGITFEDVEMTIGEIPYGTVVYAGIQIVYTVRDLGD